MKINSINLYNIGIIRFNSDTNQSNCFLWKLGFGQSFKNFFGQSLKININRKLTIKTLIENHKNAFLSVQNE